MEIKATKLKKKNEKFIEDLNENVQSAFTTLYKFIKEGERIFSEKFSEGNVKWSDFGEYLKSFAIFFNGIHKLYGEQKPQVYIDARKLELKVGDEKFLWEISAKPDENRFLISEKLQELKDEK
jgi:hypothetical protein